MKLTAVMSPGSGWTGVLTFDYPIRIKGEPKKEYAEKMSWYVWSCLKELGGSEPMCVVTVEDEYDYD